MSSVSGPGKREMVDMRNQTNNRFHGAHHGGHHGGRTGGGRPTRAAPGAPPGVAPSRPAPAPPSKLCASFLVTACSKINQYCALCNSLAYILFLCKSCFNFWIEWFDLQVI